MNRIPHMAGAVGVILLGAILGVQAQTGPFTNADWPPTINASAVVDYAILDFNASFASTPGGWNYGVTLAGGGDQAYTVTSLDGLTGDQGTSSFLNIADGNYAQFANTPQVDILLQIFGDDSLYNTDGSGKTVLFNEGILGTEFKASAGTVPPGANNGHWNWMLLSITNPVSRHAENTSGLRYIGFQASAVPPGAQNGGVNGGTLRVEGIPGASLRAVAMGPAGAFGTSNAINVFLPPAACNPEPAVNLAFIDINANVTNRLVVLDGGDQTVAYQSNVGPAGDLRKAVQATTAYMNFGVISNYLGYVCNPNRSMKVCVEVYDDPALVGASFGPESYAADISGGVATYTGPLYTLTGTGKWLKLAFWVPSVNLSGINTAPLTGGPRLVFNGGFPFIDRIELGVARTGLNPLAGLDPDPTYFLNPLICTTNYRYYAELDLQNGITNGLDVGTSGGDQNMVVELAGPAGDQRLALAPTSGNNNIQFAILNQAFGPTYQDNAHVAMALTYYDDPAMVGARLYPWPYQSFVNGVSSITFPAAPYNNRATLTGSGTWKVAYFELPNANFAGVNQGPQSIARFQTDSAVGGDPATGYIHISRVRYDVIRPCGDYQGINLFQTMRITNATPNVNVGWYGQATLQSAAALPGVWSDLLSVTNTLTNSYAAPASGGAKFFRLKFPPQP
jgi:hypothetical protein